jgi:hypothetical protein
VGSRLSPAAPRWCQSIAIVALLCVQGACAGERVVFGAIRPSTFQFTTVVEHDGIGAGGWRVAQVIVLLGRLSAVFPRAATGDVEVGVPIVNRRGHVTVEMAQMESAAAADAAARRLLQQHERPTGSLCRLFYEAMASLLGDPDHGRIPGARVTSFRTWPGRRIPRRTFPPRRGR